MHWAHGENRSQANVYLRCDSTLVRTFNFSLAVSAMAFNEELMTLWYRPSGTSFFGFIIGGTFVPFWTCRS